MRGQSTCSTESAHGLTARRRPTLDEARTCPRPPASTDSFGRHAGGRVTSMATGTGISRSAPSEWSTRRPWMSGLSRACLLRRSGRSRPRPADGAHPVRSPPAGERSTGGASAQGGRRRSRRGRRMRTSSSACGTIATWPCATRSAVVAVMPGGPDGDRRAASIWNQDSPGLSSEAESRWTCFGSAASAIGDFDGDGFGRPRRRGRRRVGTLAVHTVDAPAARCCPVRLGARSHSGRQPAAGTKNTPDVPGRGEAG